METNSSGAARDIDGAIAVLREVVASGVNHIDPVILWSAYHKPAYPARAPSVPGRSGDRHQSQRPPGCRWLLDSGHVTEELTQAVHDNLRDLGLDALDVVNLRSMFDVHGPAGDRWRGR